jgi:hypothetical protein
MVPDSIMIEETDLLEYIKCVHPHIEQRLSAMWGTRECCEYLDTLLMETERPNRRGFSPDIFKALSRLQEHHAHDFPHLKGKGDVWQSVPRR